MIRTPDQRIRVFVSSTLRELADERRAVRAAIERMQLAPVMFELGARPHPPRELYRSYLAPERRVRRDLRRQLRLGRPRRADLRPRRRVQPRPPVDAQTHLHQGEQHREERLNELIARIQTDDTAAYLPFTTPTSSRTGSPATSRRCSPSDSTSPAPRASRAETARLGIPRRTRARRPTRRRSAASASSPQVRELLARGRATAW